MKNFYKNEQSGRSMVEMLGVLAIIGVLSVGGIAGYSRAMAKFKLSKSIDQISMIVANIRTLYASQRNYTGLAIATSPALGVAPEEMIVGANASLQNVYQGAVLIGVSANVNVFGLAYTNLPREACIGLATADWGAGTASGFVGVIVQGNAIAANIAAAPAVGANAIAANSASVGANNVPLSPSNAATACADTNNSITWYYN